jgi:hypothetical protein
MHRLAVALLLGLIWHPNAQAQLKTPAELRQEAAEAELHRQEVSVLERENARALQLGSSTFFQRVYGDDYVGTNESGQIITKALLIRNVQAADVKYISVVVSDEHVRFFQETAVVQTLWSLRGTRNGQPFSRQLRVIHVYINGPRGWQVVAGQQTTLPG